MSKPHQTEKRLISPQMAIGGALFVILLVLAYNLFLGSGTIHLVSPQERAAVSAKDLTFKWNCNRKGVQLVLEVYDGADLILRQFVDQDSYTPSDDQKADFKPDHLYHWRVIPNPDVKQKYSFNEEFKSFYITTAIDRPQEDQQAVRAESESENKIEEQPQRNESERPYDPNSTSVPLEGLF